MTGNELDIRLATGICFAFTSGGWLTLLLVGFGTDRVKVEALCIYLIVSIACVVALFLGV